MDEIVDVDVIVSDEERSAPVVAVQKAGRAKEEAALVLSNRTKMGPVLHASILVKWMMTQAISRRQVPVVVPPSRMVSTSAPSEVVVERLWRPFARAVSGARYVRGVATLPAQSWQYNFRRDQDAVGRRPPPPLSVDTYMPLQGPNGEPFLDAVRFAAIPTDVVRMSRAALARSRGEMWIHRWRHWGRRVAEMSGDDRTGDMPYAPWRGEVLYVHMLNLFIG